MVLLMSNIVNLKSQTNQEVTETDYYIGSTLIMLYNLVPDDNAPDFGQLNFGYRITQVDVVSVELKTWKYAWSLGIPYGENFEKPSEKFLGYIREYGLALVYQRFIYDGLYASVHIMNAWQSFVNEEGNSIGDGFQIFNTYRVGYHFRLFDNLFFIEPSLAITHRAYHTEMPQSFEVLDKKWGKFFYGEPGLHFGFNF